MLFFKKERYPRTFPVMQIPSETPNRYQLAQMQRRFGMFLHFGINTFHNTEWSDGTLPIESYLPETIDADGWVRTAYEAGMQYVIVITKHHDGFCLWNTDTTEYSVKYSPNRTDVVAEVAKACKRYGVKLGLYYSLWDRHEACYSDDEAYVRYMLSQLTELLDGRYGEVVELWLDGSWDKTCRQWQLDRLYSHVKTLQPQCQFGVNITLGKYSERKKNPPKRYMPMNCKENDPIRMFPSDFRLWDPYMCRADDPKRFTFRKQTYYLPFECTICSRTEGWFYSDGYPQKPLRSVDEIVQNYRTIEKTSNLLVLNLPPDKSGRLVRGDVENLLRAAEMLGIRREITQED